MGKSKKGTAKFRRLVEARPPWDREKEIVAGAMSVGAEGEWDLFFHFIPKADGQLYLFGLDVRPSGVLSMKSMSELPRAGITARALRSIRLGEAIADLRATRKDHGPALDLPTDLPEQGSRPGRKGLPDEFLARVAVDYVNAFRANPSAPIREMKGSYGPGYPRDTIKGWVLMARARGFLASTTPGKSQGEPGPRLSGMVSEGQFQDSATAREMLKTIHARS